MNYVCSPGFRLTRFLRKCLFQGKAQRHLFVIFKHMKIEFLEIEGLEKYGNSREKKYMIAFYIEIRMSTTSWSVCNKQIYLISNI